MANMEATMKKLMENERIRLGNKGLDVDLINRPSMEDIAGGFGVPVVGEGNGKTGTD
jgi:hypothetical protein